MYAYHLIEGGYQVLINDVAIIHQPHSPTKGTEVPLNAEQAERLAKLCIAKLERGIGCATSTDEEEELSNFVTEARINELADICKEREEMVLQNVSPEDEIQLLKNRIKALEQKVGD